jgi:hypothetical protein
VCIYILLDDAARPFGAEPVRVMVAGFKTSHPGRPWLGVPSFAVCGQAVASVMRFVPGAAAGGRLAQRQGGHTVQQDLIPRIRDGMQVEDADGDAVGTVDELMLPVGTDLRGTTPGREAHIKVRVGIMGIGGHWYIPVSAVRTVVDDRVILDVDQTRLDEMGWGEPPAPGTS